MLGLGVYGNGTLATSLTKHGGWVKLNLTGRGFSSARANSRCLQTTKSARRSRQCPLLDGPSRAAAQRVRRHSVWVSRPPHSCAIRRLADPHDACSRTGTDRADRIAPTAAGELQQRDSARLGCLSPPDTRSSYSESLPHERARFVILRSLDQTTSPSRARAYGKRHAECPLPTGADILQVGSWFELNRRVFRAIRDPCGLIP